MAYDIIEGYKKMFPQNIQDNLNDIYTKLGKALISKNIINLRIESIRLYKIYLEMFDIAGDNESLIDAVGYLGTGWFFAYPKDLDLGINDLAKESLWYFGDLDLPVHHRVIKDTPLLLSKLKKTLNQMIEILENPKNNHIHK